MQWKVRVASNNPPPHSGYERITQSGTNLRQARPETHGPCIRIPLFAFDSQHPIPLLFTSQKCTVMSISVDDLVASLSGNHIGQEAMDLATLQVLSPPFNTFTCSSPHLLSPQAQLAQTLFSQEIPPNMLAQSGHHQDVGDVQLCNTPTSRTRSSSLSFGQMGDMSLAHRRRRSSSVTSRSRSCKNSAVPVDDNWEDVDEMDEDEQMVEDLVTPSSPMSAGSSVSNFAFTQRRMSSSSASRSPAASTQNSYDASLFTTTDPFYMAQLQASQNPQSNSAFAQSGRPAQHSPFLLQHPHHQVQNPYAHPVPMSAAYDR